MVGGAGLCASLVPTNHGRTHIFQTDPPPQHTYIPPHTPTFVEPWYLSSVNCCAHQSRTSGLVTSR